MVEAFGEKITCGIRINPEYSEVEVELYNPCAPGTRFGVTADLLPETLPEPKSIWSGLGWLYSHHEIGRCIPYDGFRQISSHRI